MPPSEDLPALPGREVEVLRVVEEEEVHRAEVRREVQLLPEGPEQRHAVLQPRLAQDVLGEGGRQPITFTTTTTSTRQSGCKKHQKNAKNQDTVAPLPHSCRKWGGLGDPPVKMSGKKTDRKNGGKV